MDLIKSIKEVANAIRKADNIPLYSQILDLQKDALDLVEENHQLKMQLSELKNVNSIEEKLIPSQNIYFLKKEQGIDGPYCTACWDKENKLIRLHTEWWSHEQGYRGQCPVCKTVSFFKENKLTD